MLGLADGLFPFSDRTGTRLYHSLDEVRTISTDELLLTLKGWAALCSYEPFITYYRGAFPIAYVLLERQRRLQHRCRHRRGFTSLITVEHDD